MYWIGKRINGSNIFLYFGLHNENQVYESGDFYSFFSPSLLMTENLQNRFFLEFLIFLLGKNLPIKKSIGN